MQYAILIYEDQTIVSGWTDQEKAADMQGHMAFSHWLTEEGILVGAKPFGRRQWPRPCVGARMRSW